MTVKQVTKDNLQKEVLSKIIKHDGHGIVALSTGSGKTKIAIDYIKYLKNPSVLWVVPTIMLRDYGIPEEFVKWDASDLFERCVETICYSSLNKLEKEHFDLVVLDEGHKLTPVNAEFFDKNIWNRVLLLSATIPHEQEKRDIIRSLRLSVIHSLEVNDAADKKIVAEFTVNVISVELDYNDRYIEKKRKADGQSFFVTEGSQYDFWCNIIDRTPNPGKHLYFSRMRVIYNSKTKFEVAKAVLNKIPEDKRVLIFCSNIDQADRICRYTYHSKTTDDDYRAFNNKQIDRLAVVNALTEGHNMVDVDYAVMIQVNSNARNFIQKQGRAIRWRPGHKAMIYIIKLLDTVDEKWVEASLENIDQKRIRNFKYEKQ